MNVDNNHSFGGLAGLNGGENSPDPFALAADAQAVLRAVRGAEIYPDEDQRRVLIRYLSSLLWVDILDISGVSGTCSRNEQAYRRAGISGKCG